jgi:hypothetical protein
MTDPMSLREALHGIWRADKYPIRGNEDWAAAARLDREAFQRAATAAPTANDRPEWAQWIAALRDPNLSGSRRDEIMSALHDLFEPEDE